MPTIATTNTAKAAPIKGTLSGSRSQSEISTSKKPKIEEPAPNCQCQAQPQPLCFTKSGEFIPGRLMKCGEILIPIRQHRPWLSFKRQPQKLFTIKQIEELLQVITRKYDAKNRIFQPIF